MTEMSQVRTAAVALRIEPNDSASSARKLVNAAMSGFGSAIMREWLADPASYDIDIELTMTKRSNP